LPQVEKKNARHLKLGIKLKNYKQDIWNFASSWKSKSETFEIWPKVEK
jgi:hypothetical protein